MPNEPDFDAAIAERFDAKWQVEPNTGCHLWIGAVSDSGYGSVSIKGKMRLAHRVSYELRVGPIPLGLLVLHRCDVRCCVNPDHLFLGTYADNENDKIAKGRERGLVVDNRAKTHCPAGHAYDTTKLGRSGRRDRACLTCDRERKRQESHKAKESHAQ